MIHLRSFLILFIILNFQTYSNVIYPEFLISLNYIFKVSRFINFSSFYLIFPLKYEKRNLERTLYPKFSCLLAHFHSRYFYPFELLSFIFNELRRQKVEIDKLWNFKSVKWWNWKFRLKINIWMIVWELKVKIVLSLFSWKVVYWKLELTKKV